jgi:hypothetical protein
VPHRLRWVFVRVPGTIPKLVLGMFRLLPPPNEFRGATRVGVTHVFLHFVGGPPLADPHLPLLSLKFQSKWAKLLALWKLLRKEPAKLKCTTHMQSTGMSGCYYRCKIVQSEVSCAADHFMMAKSAYVIPRRRTRKSGCSSKSWTRYSAMMQENITI